jgi:hypothetical protein
MNDTANNPMSGQRIKNVRHMTDAELAAEGWQRATHLRPVVLELENGVKLFAAADAQHRSPGVLLGRAPDGSRVPI